MICIGGGSLTYVTMEMKAFTSIPAIALWTFASCVIVTQTHIKQVSFFLSCITFDQLLELRERNAEERTAIETRQMIANVAHDLKTVSALKLS